MRLPRSLVQWLKAYGSGRKTAVVIEEILQDFRRSHDEEYAAPS